LDEAVKGNLETVVVSTRDRLCRFGFDLIEYILKIHGVKLLVHEQNDSTIEQDLSEDLMSIVQVFCCQGNKQNGKKRYSTKSKNTIDLNKQSEKTIKNI